MRSLIERLPQYDYLYLGDSARAPYGARSHEVIERFTRQAVTHLFRRGCPLVVLACNTASARALRNLQQKWLPQSQPDNRILGVIRPSAEALAGLPPGAVPGITPPTLVQGCVAVLGTSGTIASNSYQLELSKLAPRLRLIQVACPLWVPLVEAGELSGPGVDHYIHRYLDPLFDPFLKEKEASREPPQTTARASSQAGSQAGCKHAPASDEAAPAPGKILLGCTHYPLLKPQIAQAVPKNVQLLSQAEIVSSRLEDWLNRHPEMSARLTRNRQRHFETTDDPGWFAEQGSGILGQPFKAQQTRVD